MQPVSKRSGWVTLGQATIATVVLTAFSLAPSFHLGGAGWVFLSCLLTVTTLMALAMTARNTGWPLVGVIALVYFAVGYFNVFDELFIFSFPGVSTQVVVHQVARGLIIAAIFVPLLVWLLGRMNAESSEVQPVITRRRPIGWIWRVPVGALLYVVFFFVAGVLVFPFVKSFYAHMPMPALGSVLLMEMFRGLVYVAVAVVATRSMAGRRGRAALVVGLVLSVFGGIAPLLLPNPLLPGSVRLAHGFEVGISNFLYGMVLGWLFTPVPGVTSDERTPMLMARA